MYDLSAVPAHARSANSSEKDARAALYAAVKRVLSDRDIVVLDSLNYIKGVRYQLFCEAKAVRTPSVVLRVGCAVEQARAVNEARLERRRRADNEQEERDKDEEKEKKTEKDYHDDNEPYSPENWDNLVFRYEEANPMTRWDSPLFVLMWSDDVAQTEQVFARIWDAIAGVDKPVVRPNAVTEKRTRDAGGDYLYVLDRETQDVVARAMAALREDGGGDSVVVRVPRCADGVETAAAKILSKTKGKKTDGSQAGGDLVLQVPAGTGLPQLQRLRRAFMGLNRGGIGLEGVGNLAVDRVRELFVGYLNDHFAGNEEAAVED